MRRSVARKLVRKYVAGVRSASDVVMGLQALAAQNRVTDLQRLLTRALEVVPVVPTVLWLWACRHAHLLGVATLRHMLQTCHTDARCERHLRRHTHRLTQTPDGLVALLHENHRFPAWAPALTGPAVAAFLTTA